MLEDDNASWRTLKFSSPRSSSFCAAAAFGSAGTRYLACMLTCIRPRFWISKLSLRLTPDQEKTVMKELDDYAKYYQNIEEEREDVAEHGRQRIYFVLTPEQRKRLIIFPVLPT